MPYQTLVTIKHVIRTLLIHYYLDNCQNMEMHIIDAEQVNQFIMRLKRGKALWLDGIYHEYLIFGNSEVLCTSLASLIYWYTIDSICAEHIYDWRYHPSDKEIYTGS